MTPPVTGAATAAAGQIVLPVDRPLRIAARRSPLAVVQAEWVAGLLRAHGVEVEVVGITSQGDVDPRELTRIGGTGVFAAAVRDALLEGRADLAVHSLKDLPTAPHPGLVVAAVPGREDVREVLVGLPLDQWTDATVVGTGSPRRQAQLADLAARRGVRPRFVPVRGNVDTRLDLVRNRRVDATVLAAAGLIRLGRLDADAASLDGSVALGDVPARVLSVEHVLPAAGQGALALECRDDSPWRAVVARLDDATATRVVTAERAVLSTLEAGCTAPIGVHATADGDRMQLTAVIGADVPGADAERGRLVRGTLDADAPTADAARQLGATLAGRLLADLAQTSGRAAAAGLPSADLIPNSSPHRTPEPRETHDTSDQPAEGASS